ncbi:MAG: quaternary ammonium transporter [Hormoscilla sp. GM7CHS1pb]|nr:quaternary ammonium transporter [Hormoscilla sp. GM7CHS1pb]
MKQVRRLIVLSLLALLTAIVVVACNGGNGSTDRRIKVASKQFTEQYILGEMYAIMLEDRGFKVERKLSLGSTPVIQAGLENGEIDLYPEYTGTALTTVLKLPPSSNYQQVFDTVAKGYKEKYNLVWLSPAPMNNTWALAMTGEDAEKLGIKKISDLVDLASELVLIGTSTFEAREDGLPGLKQVYGNLEFKQIKVVDPGLRYKGLLDGQGDVVVAFGTDGEISAFNLVVLEDDKKFFPVYQVAPVVRQETLDKYPGMSDALNSISPLLTDEVMQRLNYEVSGKQGEPADVAREFLIQQGLINN